MEKYTKKEYAKYLQAKYEEYFEDFSDKTGKTKEELIQKYCEESTSKEDMYNIDIILNFFADYGSYYLYEIEQLEKNNNLGNIEAIQKRIEEIDKEYDILERLIYNTGETYISEKKEGIIKNITPEETEKAFQGTRRCTPEEMKEISNWIKTSYYIFLENYRNKVTTITAGKRNYSFEMSEENICHLLGIKKEKFKNIPITEVLKMLLDEGEIKNGLSPLERITELQKNTPVFNYYKIKYKNYLFQNFGLLTNAYAICTGIMPKTNNKWKSTTFLFSKLLGKCAKDNYSRMGFVNDNNRRYIPETLQSTNSVTALGGEIYNIKSIFKKIAKGTAKNIQEERKNISQMELCCIFSAEEQLKMIEAILEAGDLSKKNITELITYHRRICSTVAKFTKTREILKEKAKSQGRSR